MRIRKSLAYFIQHERPGMWTPKFQTIKVPPIDPTRHWWYDMSKQRRDWYMLIVVDDSTGYEFPVFVKEFDDLSLPYYKYHNQKDFRVLDIYMEG